MTREQEIRDRWKPVDMPRWTGGAVEDIRHLFSIIDTSHTELARAREQRDEAVRLDQRKTESQAVYRGHMLLLESRMVDAKRVIDSVREHHAHAIVSCQTCERIRSFDLHVGT